MNFNELQRRLIKASQQEGVSLRTLAAMLGVSHELVRKVLNGNQNLTLASFNKINKGLKKHDF